ncbi:glycosyltransferase family 2 protein [Christiangramia sediminis]|uniref:Glycosyltransferase n=1 Tax=Christiangramia sediminis TaxID=2881336 RepID=A0A9X1LJ93_9FLAO|nr:glycosyltransferase family 2 protein [Christiangramia sediminis]MCB7481332.1 glycosyltransferase [Christiangramia sediminis]
MKPTISIIIPTYNRAHLILETLESVRNQDFKNWECLIIDDHSTDNTKTIVCDFIEEDKRFRYINKGKDINRGASISRNIGISMSKGEYLQFLDSDDILASNKLKEQFEILSAYSSKCISTCKWGIFNFKSDPLELYENKADYKTFCSPIEYFEVIGKVGGFFPPHCFLIHKELLCYSGYWNENISLNDDGEFFFRIILNCEKILFTENTYVRYRNKSERKDNLSILNTSTKAQDLLNSWKIIEALYFTKYPNKKSTYLIKKKESVYFELKKAYPHLIKKNKRFFPQEIKNDNLYVKYMKVKKKIIKKIKSFIQ